MESPVWAIPKKKKQKASRKDGMKYKNLFLFADGIIFYIGSSKEATKILIRTNKFSKGTNLNQYTRINCILIL
jgi:uncharacterized membrane protein YjjP (DUF1212 family)